MYSMLKGDTPEKMYEQCLNFIGSTRLTSQKEINRKFGILRKIFPNPIRYDKDEFPIQYDKEEFRKYLEVEVAFLIIKSMKKVKNEWIL